jgi:2-polyprenyl-3-methyl-5-hydroxy-6-metoxy-1,4-benzoquinol methylase
LVYQATELVLITLGANNVTKHYKRWYKPYKPWFIIGDNGGQVHIKRQSSGLSQVDMKGKTVFELGCAEGLVSLYCEERGAALVHGLEKRVRAVEVARSLAGYAKKSDKVKFFQGDLLSPEKALNQEGMLPQYDIIMANAVLHKVTKSSQVLRMILDRCNETIVLRTIDRRLSISHWRSTDIVDFAAKRGFELDWEACGYPQGDPPYSMEGEAWMGVFHKVKD